MLRARSMGAGDIQVKEAHQSEDYKNQEEQTPSITRLLLSLFAADFVEKGHSFLVAV
jgi:hypothetical protein